MRGKPTFRDRMRVLSARLPPPPSDPNHKLLMAKLKREAEMDVAFRIKMNDWRERLPSFVLTRGQGGSGFPTGQILRHFFSEYLDRLIVHGPFSFPTSFNVVESFLSFSEGFLVFDLREEREYLLRLYEYIDWYTAGSFPDKPAVLVDILSEGIVYEYHTVSPMEDFAIETADSKLRILGAAMVRHRSELSAMIIAGEAPPFPSDDDVLKHQADQKPARGKEDIRPDPVWRVEDRYLAELPGHSRVIMLARFDLDYSCYDVRYVNLDTGASYLVLTDDRMIFGSNPIDQDLIDNSTEQLKRYTGLFSALACMLYLPAFFLDQAPRIIETRFATNLQVEGSRARSVSE